MPEHLPGQPWPDRIIAAIGNQPRVLFHATTPKKFARYQTSRAILPPVRGFDTPMAAAEWGSDKHRTILVRLEVNPTLVQILPDHHRDSGLAFWTPERVEHFTVFIAGEV